MKHLYLPQSSTLYRIVLSTAIATLGTISAEALLIQKSVQAAQMTRELVVNGGFETTTGESGNLIPAGAGLWDGDAFSTPSIFDSIAPLNGTQMLQFDGVGPDRNNPGGCCSGDLLQFIDLSEFSNEIATGTTSVSAEAFFNAIAPTGDNTYDFLLSLRAFTGEIPNTRPPDISLAEASKTISTDSDSTTWNSSSFELDLPSDTTYLALLLSATETDENGNLQRPPGGFFPGSFADDVSVILRLADTDSETSVPEPSIILGALAYGLYGLFSGVRNRYR